MSYTEHLLSSSSSLKNKEVLVHHVGGKWENESSLPCWQLVSHHLWTWHASSPCLFWVVSLADSVIIMIICPHYCYEFTLSVVLSVQVVPAAKLCFMPLYVQRVITLSPPPLNVKPSLCVSTYSVVSSVHTISRSDFVSMMWESLWPTFDESIPVDTKSLSRN